MDAAAVPGKLWETILAAHTDLVEAQLGYDAPAGVDAEGIRLLAAEIAGSDDPDQAIDRYVHPNDYRGQGGTNSDQLYHKPRMTVVLDASRNNGFLAAVGTVMNTSPSVLPGVLGKRAEQHIKMHVRPEFPLVGGHRFNKVTSAIFVGEPAAALVGLHCAVKGRPSKDQVSVYNVLEAPADAEMGFIADAALSRLGYQGTQYKTGIPGYAANAPLACYTATNGAVRFTIEGYSGAREAIANAQELTTIPARWQDI